MKPFKFAVAGCGNIGKRHVAVLDAEPRAQVVAICDIEEEKASKLADLYGYFPCYTQYEHMLDETDADIIVVATPHALHAGMTIEACNRGFHVLVEKPMALTVADCMRMNEAAYKNEVKLWVVKQNRYNIPIRLAKEALEQQRLGKLLMVKCDVLWNRYQGYYNDSPWRGRLKEEGGALFTQVSHFIDLLIWWCGEVEEVSGYLDTQQHQIEIEDIGSAILRFNSGALCSLNWTTNVYNKNYEGSITLIGEKGTIKIGGKYLNKIEYWDVEGFPLQEGIAYTDKPNAYGKYQGTSSNHDKVVSAILDQLGKKGRDTVDGFEGMKSIQAIEKIYANIRKYATANYL
ncbi:MAG: gfo/Idh/MocA family oxidoreductase [Bacteroidetes bacterium]|nr:MAG: gfo/Idh/MocA family oxidoreductase [Bacteroidota bacterium]